MRRFDDIKEVTVGDVRVLDGGDLEVYVRRSKMDQEGKWSVLHMSREIRNGFSIPDVLCWYINSLDLRVLYYLFPRL